MEVIVALVVTSIVAMSILFVIQLVSRYFYDYQRKIDKLNTIALFVRNVQNDCFFAEDIRETGNSELSFSCYEEQITYKFFEKHIVRLSSARRDSFPIKLYDFKIMPRTREYDKMVALEIKLGLQNDTLPFFFVIKGTNRRLINEKFHDFCSK